jgi:topoisomerase-4 subunit A
MDQPDITFQADEPADSLTLARYAERAYLDYAVSVVKGRALPEVADGQKPVQRRILFAMQAMGLRADAKPVKSARVVGEVLGKFHPHGDQSAYDALVRMAQDFSLRYPLIDGQGNFGSRDGDGAAAMRYTEARLTPISRLLLDEIDMGTVDFLPNYDGSEEEPKLLPARLPFVLLNGASGIAVGMATEIPPHNLREVAGAAVAMIRNPNISLAELLALMPGRTTRAAARSFAGVGDRPDLRKRPRQPEGARALDHRGNGARPVADGGDRTAAGHVGAEGARGNRGNHQPEDPHRQEGADARADPAQGDDAVRARRGARRVGQGCAGAPGVRAQEQEHRAAGLHPDAAGAHQPGIGAPINLVMIGTDGRPRQKGLQILREWIEFRFATVTRRTRFQLTKVEDRIHILEGRMLVLLNIDEVIRIIRESDEPKPR